VAWGIVKSGKFRPEQQKQQLRSEADGVERTMMPQRLRVTTPTNRPLATLETCDSKCSVLGSLSTTGPTHEMSFAQCSLVWPRLGDQSR